MLEQRNLFIAIALSLAIMVGYDFFLAPKKPAPRAPGQQTAGQTQPGQTRPGVPTTSGAPKAPGTPGTTAAPAVPGTASAPAAPAARPDRAAVLARSKRLRIATPRLSGSISLAGGILDDLTLTDYRTEVAPDSPKINLLSPIGTEKPYFIELGWAAASGDAIKLPGRETLWKASADTLGAGGSVTLSWDNGAGLLFTRTFAVDENFMFTVTQKVVNRGTKSVSLFPYGLASRSGTPPDAGFILHEGPIGVFRSANGESGTLDEVTYEDLRDDGKVKKSSVGGWIGITDQYWVTALVPDQRSPYAMQFTHSKSGPLDKYQVDYLGPAQKLAPGGSIQVTNHVFAGAKELRLLESYAERYGIEKFDLAIDFGWFYFLAKPIFQLLQYLNNWIGSFGLAILVLTLLIKILFLPLANKSYRAMAKMRSLQPEVLKLRERFGADKQKLNQEMMGLYKQHKVNPMSGCLPMIVQIPVFIALYQVLLSAIEMRHAPFYGWIQDLSAQDPTSFVNLFGLLPFEPPQMLMIGAWPLIMGASMFLQQKLNPTPPDPVQAKIFAFMPVIFTIMLARFPSGLVIYWAWNNTLSIGQQYLIMRRHGAFTKKTGVAKT